MGLVAKNEDDGMTWHYIFIAKMLCSIMCSQLCANENFTLHRSYRIQRTPALQHSVATLVAVQHTAVHTTLPKMRMKMVQKVRDHCTDLKKKKKKKSLTSSMDWLEMLTTTCLVAQPINKEDHSRYLNPKSLNVLKSTPIVNCDLNHLF